MAGTTGMTTHGAGMTTHGAGVTIGGEVMIAVHRGGQAGNQAVTIQPVGIASGMLPSIGFPTA